MEFANREGGAIINSVERGGGDASIQDSDRPLFHSAVQLGLCLRDANAFPGLKAPRTPAYDAAPDASAPQWQRNKRALSAANSAGIDRDFRMRAQSVSAPEIRPATRRFARALISTLNMRRASASITTSSPIRTSCTTPSRCWPRSNRLRSARLSGRSRIATTPRAAGRRSG